MCVHDSVRRVGQAVDVVAQAGRPKTITGFQTHNTPVSKNVIVLSLYIIAWWISAHTAHWYTAHC